MERFLQVKEEFFLRNGWVKLGKIISENHADEIFNAFQRCGMCNAIDGSENYRVKVPRVENYQVPAIDAQPEPLPKKKKRKKGKKKEKKEEKK